MADDYATKDLKCSFCGKDQNEIEKLVCGTRGANICDKCIELCNDIMLDRVPPDHSDMPAAGTPEGTFIVWDVVAHYANSNVREDISQSKFAVEWVCGGCGWRLKLAPGAKPPSEHSTEIFVGPPLSGNSRELPAYEVAPRCPNPEWKKFP
jgi:hypothetical protein